MNTLRKSALLTVLIALLTVSVTLLTPQPTHAVDEDCRMMFEASDQNGNYLWTSDTLVAKNGVTYTWVTAGVNTWYEYYGNNSTPTITLVTNYWGVTDGHLSITADGRFRWTVWGNTTIEDEIQVLQNGSLVTLIPNTTSGCPGGGWGHSGG